MKRILLSEAGGTLMRNVVASLRAAPEPLHIVGISSNPYELVLSNCDESYLVPPAADPDFLPTIADIAKKTGAGFLHSQHDAVIKILSARRSELPLRTFLPDPRTVAACIDKYESYRRWAAAGMPVPRTLEIGSEEALREAFATLGPTIWLRLKEGGGGAGALPTDNFAFAKAWIDRFDGWGHFVAAELLSAQSVTWTSLWQNGELILAQGRKRINWLFANRTLSGVTGVTGVAETVSDPQLDDIAERAIRAIDTCPSGIFSVDLTYSNAGEPCLTEINIGRFFTTIHFFTEAGVNFPYIFVALAYGERPPLPEKRINPLTPGLLWVRGMDTAPVLVRREDLKRGLGVRGWARQSARGLG